LAAYDFVALDERGREQNGVLEADSVRQIRQILRDRGWAPLKVDPAVERHRRRGLSLELPRGSLSSGDLALVTRQLATLIQAGLPVEEALQGVSEQAEKGRLRSMLLAVRAKVLEGHSLAASLGEFPGAFPHLYRSTVSAGEHSGHLDLVLQNLADYTERRQESRQNVQMALFYPIALFVVAVLIVSGLLIYVVPDIVKVYEDTQQDLPGLTRALIWMSEFLAEYVVFVVIAIALVVFGVHRLFQQPAMRRQLHRRMLELPLLRRLSRGVNASQFASTLSILTSSGVPLVDALRIAGEVLSNVWLRERVAEATQRVSEGTSLRAALDSAGYFPPIMLHMIASGEASGELDEMLARVAKLQQNDLERLVTVLVRMFEPMMLLLMGGIVLLIVLAILLPILNLNELANI
jgi:general secretion pathway protein F